MITHVMHFCIRQRNDMTDDQQKQQDMALEETGTLIARPPDKMSDSAAGWSQR